MSRSWVRATRNMGLPIGCVCGKCQTVRVIFGSAHIEATQSYVISRDKAENIASQRIIAASRKLIESINHYAFGGFWLGDEKFDLHVGENGETAKVTLSNIDKPCPVCGHKEPWQEPTWKRSDASAFVSKLDDLHKPKTWQKTDELLLWGNETAKKVLADKLDYWKEHPDEAEKLTVEKRKTEQMISLADSDLKRFPEFVKLSTKLAEKETKEQQQKETRRFSAERKELGQAIKSIDREIQDLKNSVEEKKRAYASVKGELTEKLQQLQRQSIGLEGKITLNKNSSSIWWQLF